MNFNLESFKKVVEKDLSTLEQFRKVYDSFLDTVEDEYLDTVFTDKHNSFIDKYCEGICDDHNTRLYMFLVVSNTVMSKV